MNASIVFPTPPLLACVDLLAGSDHVVEQALALAAEQKRSLMVLHVVHETAQSCGFYQRHNHTGFTLPFAEIAKNLLMDLVAEAKQRFFGSEEPAQPVVTRIVEGIPACRIVEMADLVDARSIILATGERPFFDRLWNGSVTEGVKRRSKRNIVILAQRPGTRRSGGTSSRFAQLAH